MEDILYRAVSYLLMIVIGAVLKKVGFFKEGDFQTLAKVLLNVTLPCAIIYNFSHIQFDVSLLVLTVGSIACGVGLILTGMLGARMAGKREQMPFDAVNLSGFNIGNFCLPFAQSFLSPQGLLAISLFDTGNALICNGGSKAAGELAQQSLGGKDRQRAPAAARLFQPIRTIFHALSHSVPFLTYLIMLVVALLSLPVPKLIVSLSSLGSQANPFVAMLMIGVGFKLQIRGAGAAHVARILLLRYAVTISLALVSYFLLPFSVEIRQALVLAFLSPIASACPAYTAELGEDYELSSTINSISMLISIGLITAALLVML